MSTRGFLEDELVRHRHHIKLLEKDLQERDEAGQRRIEKMCKEHAAHMASLESAIAEHQSQIDLIESKLADVYHVA